MSGTMGGRSHDHECEVCGCWWGGLGWDYEAFPECPCTPHDECPVEADDE